MNNLIRLALVAIYPLVLLITFIPLYQKYRDTIIDNFRTILLNSFLAFGIIALGLLVFFHYEDTIYAYDYAGHWIRALSLRRAFFENPAQILSMVYQSMNHADYSYLPALFGLPLIIINQSYTFFALSNLAIFLLPTFVVLMICYLAHRKQRSLPLIAFLALYPGYLTLFYGKVDCCGLYFLAIAYALIILPDFKDITAIDNLVINLCAFLAIFLRRWYLYSVVALYLSYLIKWFFVKDKQVRDIYKLLSSGIIALIIALCFFRPFIFNSLTNNFAEAYAFYDREGKIAAFINYLSLPILLIALLGAYRLLKERKELLVINLLAIILPCALIWRIQSFEFHHYYCFLINVAILFACGLDQLYQQRSIAIVLTILLLAQSLLIFNDRCNIPGFSTIKKTPEILDNKEALIELSQYIKTIEPDENYSAFLATGTYGVLTDDLLRNALLPDIDFPNIDSAVFDLRDGLPANLQYIKYIIVSEPTLYSDREYQHMFDIIKTAVQEAEGVCELYQPLKKFQLNDEVEVIIYERIGDYTEATKKYFYDEIMKYYPDKADFFSYLLD